MSKPTFEILKPLTNATQHDAAAALSKLRSRQIPKSQRNFEASAPKYQLDSGLQMAINMALSVGAPLLLTGEPGTGKTQIAYYLKWYFGIPLFKYVVRSASSSEDIKYDFDAVAYLREAQHPNSNGNTKQRNDLLTKNALWQAYQCETECIVLIDEIDKAPRDFPNDLLQELDKHCFTHPFEPNTEIAAPQDRPPIVIITSNAERRLPDAFLRRCIYHSIELTEELLSKAVAAHIDDFPQLKKGVKQAALQRFMEIRDLELINKKPSTGEILVWMSILSASGITAQQINDAELRQLPAIAALIKDKDDLARL